MKKEKNLSAYVSEVNNPLESAVQVAEAIDIHLRDGLLTKQKRR